MKKVLIIEDDTFIRDMYVKAFERSSYEVDIAIDGQDALDKVSVKKYDVILLDIMLPKVTGLQVLRYIRSLNTPEKNTPVFLTTNLGQDDIIKEAFAIGADGYLLKAQLTPSQVVQEINTFFSTTQKVE